MSALTMLLQVWEKMWYLPIWCQNLVGGMCANCSMEGEERGRHPWMDILKTFVPPYVWDGPEWVGGMTGVGPLPPSYSWYKFLPWSKYVPCRGAHPYPTFWCHIFPTKFWHQIGKYIFSQTWRSIVSVDIVIACLDTCIIFCFAIWINYILYFYIDMMLRWKQFSC